MSVTPHLAFRSSWRGSLALAVASLAAALFAPGCGPSPATDARAQATAVARPPQSISDGRFAQLIQTLSEPGGYFDTDNLISNEASYLHVVGALEREGVTGGAYIGVGPDQNFSYLAHVQPRIAFIVDIRRDNLIQQLMFKAMFELSGDRREYLALLYGRTPPSAADQHPAESVEALLATVDAAAPLPDHGKSARERVREHVLGFGYPLTDDDLDTLDRFHRTFIASGLDLRFQSFGRPPRFFYPDHRQLLQETDLAGRPASYVASEEAFARVKRMQSENRVIPVVGDLAGQHALPRIGEAVAEMGLTVSAFYTSNVEFYLWAADTFDRFAETVAALPTDDRSMIIRSHFGGGFRTPHPQAVPGYYSTQLLQRIQDFVRVHGDAGFESYGDLVTRDALSLVP